MSKMIDLIRQSAVPANVMRSASKGALAVPADEMIEILVHLTTTPVFAEAARMTLAGWDENACLAVAQSPQTPWQVLEYLIVPENRRPRLVPALLENPSVREVRLLEMGQSGSREIVDMMLASQRVRRSADILHALVTNPHLNQREAGQIKAALEALGEDTAEFLALADEDEKSQYEIEHADEIAAEEGKAFELVGGVENDHDTAPAPAAAPAASAPAPAAAPAAVPAAKAAAPERERVSVLQKISRLSVGQRVQLAMKGNKDERFILIRDGSKVVSSAVLQSPKLSDAEVETFAAMKNVQESVLRDITRSRKFMKNYAVIRNLVNNPRCPLDLGLTLINHLLVNDLKGLSMNKNVSETLRKMSLKKYREKSTPPGGKKTE